MRRGCRVTATRYNAFLWVAFLTPGAGLGRCNCPRACPRDAPAWRLATAALTYRVESRGTGDFFPFALVLILTRFNFVQKLKKLVLN